MMKENDLIVQFNNHPVLPGLIDTIAADKTGKIRIEGLSGSSRAMILSIVFNKTQTTHLVVIPEKEDAAYFFITILFLCSEKSLSSFSLQHTKDLYNTNKQSRQTLSSGLKY